MRTLRRLALLAALGYGIGSVAAVVLWWRNLRN